MQQAVERTLWEELAALLRAAAAIRGQPAQLWEERAPPRACRRPPRSGRPDGGGGQYRSVDE